MPLPPKLSTACGTFRSTKMRRPAASMRAGATGRDLALGRQRAEHLVEQRAERRRIDIADHADLQFVAREHAAGIGLEVVARNQRNRFQRAVERTSVRMIRKRRAPPQAVADIVRVRGLAPQRRQHLLAIALDRVGVETRRVEREPHQLEAFVHLVAQDAKRAAEIVALHAKAEFDGGTVHALLKGARIEIAGAFVEQRRRHMADAGLFRRILIGAALHREIHRDQRHRGFAHQPGLDPARAHDALDLGRRRRRRAGERSRRTPRPARRNAKAGIVMNASPRGAHLSPDNR